jgi:hypothetical protein
MNIENAKYIKHEVEGFDGNPLIEALRTALEPKYFANELLHKY